MSTLTNIVSGMKVRFGTGLIVAGVAGMLAIITQAYCQAPDNMAPPVDQAPATGGNPAADNVFNWSEVPQNQNVPLDRAAFDQGGYQLYDTQGETIIVPFANDNLYVMKFAQSDDGTMYFVNDGSAPILYLPSDGYLENAAVPGARWYPFSHYHPDHPVYFGIAPSWDAFVGLGWYHGLYFCGGYYSNDPWYAGAVFAPTIGLFFEFGGQHFYGWDSYHDYWVGHPGFSHIGYYNRSYYRWAARPFGGRTFNGSGHPFGGGHAFGGGSGNFGGHVFRGAGGGNQGSHGAFGGGGTHTFNGAGGGSHSFGGGGDHAFSGGGTHTFHGATGSSSSHSFGGGGSSSGGGRTFGGAGHTSNGGSSSGGHTFNGGSHNSGGSSHDSGSGHDSGGGDHGGGGGGNDQHDH